MNLFITVIAVLGAIVFLVGGLMFLINYTISKTSKSREKQIAERHDALVQQAHFNDLNKN